MKSRIAENRRTMSNPKAADFWSYRIDNRIFYKTAKGEIKQEELEARPYTNAFTYIDQEDGIEKIFPACKTAKDFNQVWSEKIK